jgi:hypothetical protein
MSKKHKFSFSSSASQNTSLSSEQVIEYKIIKKDLIRLAILNIVFLGIVLAVYYTNQDSQYLSKWFSSLIKL